MFLDYIGGMNDNTGCATEYGSQTGVFMCFRVTNGSDVGRSLLRGVLSKRLWGHVRRLPLQHSMIKAYQNSFL